jgi:hypothetical protein
VGEIMRTWLAEGRVSADSLLWREGWSDWREAGDVFPQLKADQSLAFLGAVAADAEPLPIPQAIRHKPRPATKDSQIVVVFALLMAVVVLFAIIIVYTLLR